MTSPFLWRSEPSAIAESIKPSRMARTKAGVINLAPKRLHTISSKQAEILRDRFGGAYNRAVSSAVIHSDSHCEADAS